MREIGKFRLSERAVIIPRRHQRRDHAAKGRTNRVRGSHPRSVTTQRETRAQYAARLDLSRFIDSHTEGEPTRVLVAPDGGPFRETLPEVLSQLTKNGRVTITDEWLAISGNPRAAEATVCALCCAPSTPKAYCGVLFWNATAVLGMCGHGTIGLVRSMMDRQPDARQLRIETRVGEVVVESRSDGTIAFDNVPSRVHARDVEVPLPQGGAARGDIAWGGNWFFIVRHDGSQRGTTPGSRAARPMRSHAEELAYARAIQQGIDHAGLRAGAENGGMIDHIELVFPPSRLDADARNFVLCPNGSYDRSPCGTGTSALLASLAERGELAPSEAWRQESAIGSVFQAHYKAHGPHTITPTIAGRAFLLAQGTLRHDPTDPSRYGTWKELA